jgi:cyanate permease
MVVMFVYGISLSLATVNLPKTLGIWFPSEQLGLASGIMGAAYGVGSGLALLISGTVPSPALGGWQNVLHLWSGLTALLGVLWLLTVRDRARPRPTHP